MSGNFTNPCLALSNSFCALNKNHSSIYCTFCCIVGNVFLFFFGETFFRNLKIVEQYTFGFMTGFAIDTKITLKSLLNMTFHETYMWPVLWPQEFLIESSCKFISFHVTSDTNSGSYDLRHFNWKVVWKPNWVKVFYHIVQVPRYSAIVSTVLLPLYWEQVSLLEVLLNFLPFSKTTEFWFKNSVNFILDLFNFRSTKLLQGISTGWPKKLLMFDQA